MKSTRLVFFLAVFLATGLTETTDKALGQIVPCGSIGSNCYRAHYDNRIYQFMCCNGSIHNYNSNDCWSDSSSSCVQACWTQVIHTSRRPIAACGDDSSDTNWCFIERCRSPVFRKWPHD